MEYRLLGPVEVVAADRVVPIGGGRRLSLLALLLIHAREVLPAEWLVDEIWGESPPATVAKSLQVRVSELRRALGGADGPLRTRGRGYVLEVEDEQIDSRRFELRLGEARSLLAAGDAGAAADHLDAALGLWRGPALSGVEYEPFAQAEIGRLEELRLVALEERAEAALAMGDHARAVPGLEALARAHPLRERLSAQLMRALYGAGRQADALAVYREASRVFADQLGLEPSEELRRIERAILDHDPALEPPARDAVPADLQRDAGLRQRAVLVASEGLAALPLLLALAEPLAAAAPARELVITTVVDPSTLAAATTALAGCREELIGRGVSARTAAFSSPSPGEDIVRLARERGTDLVLLAAGAAPLEGHADAVLRDAPPDVALVLEAGGPMTAGPVVVPFGAAWHDWAALELGAWVARATAAPLRLIGAASESRPDRRDASRLLADASLIVQRQAGVIAEPLLGRPGREGVTALARGAGLLVVGLSERWEEEGLGRIRSAIANEPPAPTVLVRRGGTSRGVEAGQSRTRFGWSLTPGMR